MRKIQLIFWLHFLFATVSHILLPLMIIGTIQILVAQQLGIVLSGLILGCVVFSLQFLVNHLTNPDSFCILNDLENYYREEIGLPKVTGFLPRYYAKLKEIKDILKV